MPEGSETERLCRRAVDTCAAYNFRRTARVVTQFFDSAFAPLGLRATQVAVLQTIAVTNSSSIAQLAREMAMDPSTLVRNLKPLVRTGLVQCNVDRGRAKQARLTPLGRSRIPEIMACWEQAQAQFGRRYGAARWNELRAELRFAREIVRAENERRRPVC